jgi:hypothetical protein
VFKLSHMVYQSIPPHLSSVCMAQMGRVGWGKNGQPPPASPIF